MLKYFCNFYYKLYFYTYTTFMDVINNEHITKAQRIHAEVLKKLGEEKYNQLVKYGFGFFELFKKHLKLSIPFIKIFFDVIFVWAKQFKNLSNDVLETFMKASDDVLVIGICDFSEIYILYYYELMNKSEEELDKLNVYEFYRYFMDKYSHVKYLQSPCKLELELDVNKTESDADKYKRKYLKYKKNA